MQLRTLSTTTMACLFLVCSGLLEAAIPTSERAALIAFYESTNGDEWENNDGWLGPPGTECLWFGVTCDDPAHVTRIEFDYNDLRGVLPADLGDLPFLQALILDTHPELNGPLPEELFSLTNLEELFIRSSPISGWIPESVCDLDQLRFLTLRSSGLSGPIPLCIGDMPRIEYVDFAFNDLSGSIPPELSNANESLTHLDLRQNALHGPIPPEIGDLTGLTYLNLSQNLLEGPLPEEIGNLIELTQFFLNENRLVGIVGRSILNLTNLWEFPVFRNGLDAVDPEVVDFLRQESSNWHWPERQAIPPVEFEILSISNSSVELGWDNRGDEFTRGHHEVQVSPVSEENWQTVNRIPRWETTSWTVFGLHPETTYKFRLRSVNDRMDGYSPKVVGRFSDEVVATTTSSFGSWFVDASGQEDGDCVSPATACRSIQQAADLAADGDTIRIAPGSYDESIVLDKSIGLQATVPLQSIIDPQGEGRAIEVVGAARPVINSLHLRGGDAEFGGAIFVGESSSLAVQSCRIEASTAVQGGGLFVSSSAWAVVEDSLFQNCSAAEKGGGVFSDGLLYVRDSRFLDNQARLGGGLADEGPTMVHGSVFRENRAVVGAGILSHGSYLNVHNSSIVRNTGAHCAGIALDGSYKTSWGYNFYLYSSTISENTGGGICNITYDTRPTVFDSTITNNLSAGDRSSGIVSVMSFVIRGSIVSGNQPQNCDTILISKGFNLSDDATCGFDQTTDFPSTAAILSELIEDQGPLPHHVPLPGSPAIDAGDPRAYQDQLGTRRFIDGNSDGWPQPDIGAVELNWHVFSDGFESGDLNRWMVVGG